MRTLIAITSCGRDSNNGTNQAARETWVSRLPSFGLDYRFFIGVGEIPKLDLRFEYAVNAAANSSRLKLIPECLDLSCLKGDEVLVDAPDGYGFLSYKTRAMRRWAVAEKYDFIFKIDLDTFLHVDRFVKSHYSDFDYWGSRQQHVGYPPYAAGWQGYSLSRRACQLIDDAEMDDPTEDAWTGRVCQKFGIELQDWGSENPTNNGYLPPDSEGVKNWLRTLNEREGGSAV